MVLNDAMEMWLNQPEPEDGISSHFDAWLHSQLVFGEISEFSTF
jgi:hypothetical protein